MQSKWFQVKAIYFYGPLLLKYPRKSRSKWDRMGKLHQGGNMRELRSHFQQAGLYPTCFRLVLPYIKELWGKCVGNEICTIRTLVAKSFTLDIGAMYIRIIWIYSPGWLCPAILSRFNRCKCLIRGHSCERKQGYPVASRRIFVQVWTELSQDWQILRRSCGRLKIGGGWWVVEGGGGLKVGGGGDFGGWSDYSPGGKGV